jgi:hypothetical protein
MKITKTIFFFLIITSFEVLNAQLPKPDNYIIFFDFSSRIEISDQRKKDTELLNYLIVKFKTQVEQLYKSGKIYSEDKLSILFYPDLENDNIIALTSSLKLDFYNLNFKQKLGYYMSQFPKDKNSLIMDNFNKIYDIALLQNPNYFGSNIFDFFSYSLDLYLLKGHKNHIIIFTDGYMYMAGENPENKGNKIGHLEGTILDPLRASKNWNDLFKTQKWGLISSGYKVPKETTITVLEVNPDCINNLFKPRTNLKPLRPCPNEFKILTQFWTDWFLDMDFNANNINIFKTSNDLNGVKSNLNLLFRK